MKSINILVIQRGTRFKLHLIFKRNTRKSFDEINQFVKETCGADAEIEKPDRLKKYLSEKKEVL